MRVKIAGTWSMRNSSISACKGNDMHSPICNLYHPSIMVTPANYAVGLQRRKRTQRAFVKLWIGLASC